MDTRTRRAIEQLEDSGNSAAVSLADHLRNVAANGGEQATTEAMREEARAIIEAAEAFLTPKHKAKPSHTIREALELMRNAEPLLYATTDTRAAWNHLQKAILAAEEAERKATRAEIEKAGAAKGGN